MTTTSQNPLTPTSRFTLRQTAFLAVLLLLGVGFIALAGYWAVVAWKAPPPEDLAAEAHADLHQRGWKPLSAPLQKLLDDPDYKPVPTQALPLLGQTAPEFRLLDTDDKPWELKDALGKGPVVLVFYYGYNCNHCVGQLFGLHKDIDKFRELGATVVAVSADPAELTRERFKKYGAFAFPVLSDPGNKVAETYGVYRRKPNGEEGDLVHGTFILARDGTIRWINTGEEPFTENHTVLVEAARAENRGTAR